MSEDENVRDDAGNANERADQFYEFLAYLRNMSEDAYKATMRGELSIDDLLSYLPQAQTPLKGDNCWIMIRNTNESDSPYEVIPKYAFGNGKNEFTKISNQVVQESFPKAVMSAEDIKIFLIAPADSQKLLKINHHFIIAKFNFGDKDYLLMFSAKEKEDKPNPFDSYHQSFLFTVLCFIKAGYRLGHEEGYNLGQLEEQANSIENRFKEAIKNESIKEIKDSAKLWIDFWISHRSLSNIRNPDEVCATFIEYWRRELTKKGYKQDQGTIWHRINEVVKTISFNNNKISIKIDDKELEVTNNFKMTIFALARLYFWMGSTIRLNSKEDECVSKEDECLIKPNGEKMKYSDWLNDGNTVFSNLAEKNDVLKKLWEVVK